MRTITVKRLVADGPFNVGAVYGVAAGDKDEHFTGVVQQVARLDGKWIELTVGLCEPEHERLLASRR